MRIGMLWYDNDPQKSLADKISQAATYYKNKYGSQPTFASVNQKALETETTIAGLTVSPSRAILPGHIWMGIEMRNALPAPKEDQETTPWTQSV